MSDKKLSLLVNFIGIDKMTGVMKNIVGLGRDGSKSIKALTGEAKKLDNQMRDLEKNLAASIQSQSGNVTELMGKHRALAAQIAATTAQLERQKRLAAIRADTNVMRRTGENFRQRGQDNMLGGVGMATPFILASKAAMDFSSGMVDIQQKAELTNAETARMAARILDLSKVAHQLPEDMRSGIDTLAGLGLDPRKAIEMIGPIGRLGTAFKVELADGANAAFSNLNNLKVPIGETAKALDIMAASGNAGAFEVKDMARWFPALTAQMQALGQKGTPAVADLAAALQIARRGAGDADAAANNIQNLLGKIQSPETVKKFAKFGIDLPNALKKAAREGKTPLEAIAELTQKATKGDTAKMGNLFEDMQAQGALRSLILNMDDFRKMREDIAKSGGTVERAFAQREAQDASISWRDFMGAVQRLGITLGTSFLPAATRFLGVADGMISRIAAFAQANPGLAGTLMTVTGGLVAARIAVGALQFTFGGLLKPLATAIGWFREAMLIGRFAGVLQMIIPMLGAISAPMLLMGAAIGGAAYLIYSNWAGIAAFVGGVWAGITGFFTSNWTTIRNVMLGAMVIFAPWLAAAVYAGSVIYRNWDSISGVFVNLWHTVSNGVSSMVGAVSGFVAPFIAPFIQIGEFLVGLAGRWVSYGADLVGGLIKGIGSMTWQLIKAAVDLAASVGAAFAEKLGIKSPSRVFMAFGGHITDGLARGIEQGSGDPANSARNMAGRVAAVGALAFTPISPATATAQPIAAAGGAGGITVNVYGAAGQDVRELARAVIAEIKHATGIEARSSFDLGDGR